MYPFWDDVIAPAIEAVGAKRVIEVGALRGDTTVRMLERLGPDCELHVIDPVPQFDPAEHEARFPGRYIFHLGISHDVLPNLPPADVALIDGDHNWYTVYHELRMLAETARAASEPLPLLILHDVCWPYGRRDLYYEPSRIPEEFRQPYRQAGMRPGFRKLLPIGGMNPTLDNAVEEGGPRNGVMTALDDFIAEHDAPLRRVVIPIYFGLALVADERRLAASPELAALFDRLEVPADYEVIVELAEKIRLEEAMSSQGWIFGLQDMLAQERERYVRLVKAALLDELYLDNELRLDHLLATEGRSPADLEPLRDPPRTMRDQYQAVARARANGQRAVRGRPASFFPYTDVGHAQLDRLAAAVQDTAMRRVPGDLVEVGAGRGGGGIFLRAVLDAYDLRGRSVVVVDPFRARLDPPRRKRAGATDAVAAFGADLNQVRDGFARFGLLDDRVRFVQGEPPGALADAGLEAVAVLRIGAPAAHAAGEILDAVAPVLSPGAVVVVEGTADDAVEAAVNAARDRLGMGGTVERVDWNTVSWQLPEDWREDRDVQAPAPRVAAFDALGASGAGESVALSVVVVFHDMAREARRTLTSLSRSYQREVEDLAYEVIVVDNGSSPEQRLDEAFVAGFGPEFRLLDMGPDAPPSPTAALNAGIAAARGDVLALMIDGAHVLSPGVLHYGMKASDIYGPAVVATQQWYVGPGQQGDVQHAGYDQAAEDRLFESIEWPADGYRLFEISHFIGERDWFDGIVESNCLFVPRKVLEQVGGFDEAFSMPGGGYANLDLLERVAFTPGVNVATILGEGSFHQFHGGTTTNVADEAERRNRITSYLRHFRDLRGRDLIGLDRPLKFVGSLEARAARRTRARVGTGFNFDALRDPVAYAPEASVPLPDELKLAAIAGVWEHRAWREATWLGRPVNRYPADLHAYQELLVAQRPAAVVVSGDDDGLGGRALFVASICDQLGAGNVVAVGIGAGDHLGTHPRVTYVDGDVADAGVAARVRELVPAEPAAMVLLAVGDFRRVKDAFELYAPLVPVGGYLVVENTIVNGRPVAPAFGAGPQEAVFQLLAKHHDFVIDPVGERYTVTFNRNGYLRRTAAG